MQEFLSDLTATTYAGIVNVTKIRRGTDHSPGYNGIVRLSEFDQKLGKTRIHHSLIVQHSGSWPEGENQHNST